MFQMKIRWLLSLVLIPFLGAVPDTANAVWYAGLSLTDAIPIVGDLTDAGKIAKDAANIKKDTKIIAKIGEEVENRWIIVEASEEAEIVSKGAAEPAYTSFKI